MTMTPLQKARRAVERAAKEEGVSPAEMAGRVLGDIISEPLRKIEQAARDAGLKVDKPDG